MKASWLPSRDQTGSLPREASSPTRAVLPLAASMIQSCEYGLPVPSLFDTLYAICERSGDSSTSPTDLIFRRSADCSRSCAGAAVAPASSRQARDNFIANCTLFIWSPLRIATVDGDGAGPQHPSHPAF